VGGTSQHIATAASLLRRGGGGHFGMARRRCTAQKLKTTVVLFGHAQQKGLRWKR
jgi:hypothetical protein